jgi:hypothetical protein
MGPTSSRCSAMARSHIRRCRASPVPGRSSGLFCLRYCGSLGLQAGALRAFAPRSFRKSVPPMGARGELRRGIRRHIRRQNSPKGPIALLANFPGRATSFSSDVLWSQALPDCGLSVLLAGGSDLAAGQFLRVPRPELGRSRALLGKIGRSPNPIDLGVGLFPSARPRSAHPWSHLMSQDTAGMAKINGNRCDRLRILGVLGWLPFLNTYRTMCLSPNVAFRETLEQIRVLRIAA